MTAEEKRKQAELQAEIDNLNMLIKTMVDQICTDLATILERATDEKRATERPQAERITTP